MVGLQLALTTHKAILCPKLACDSPPPLNLQDDNNEIIAITTPVPDSTYASHRIEIAVSFFSFSFTHEIFRSKFSNRRKTILGLYIRILPTNR